MWEGGVSLGTPWGKFLPSYLLSLRSGEDGLVHVSYLEGLAFNGYIGHAMYLQLCHKVLAMKPTQLQGQNLHVVSTKFSETSTVHVI